MTSKRPKVLLTYISDRRLPSFVLRDIRILQEEVEVTPFCFRGRHDIPRLVAKVATHDVIISWFAWDQAFWGNLVAGFLGRGSITIAGGFDVVNLPEIEYGNLRSAANARRTRQALSRADVVLAVSQSIARDAVAVSGRKDIRVVHHGFDQDSFPLSLEKKPLVLTVGAVTSSNIRRKGIGCFIDAAPYLPDVPFVVAGRIEADARPSLGALPSNVRLLGEVPDEHLVKLMGDARVYVQVSAHEGFGCSLAEAMLCGCVPVVTDRGAIPEVVGDVGYYVPFDAPKETARAIQGALASDHTAGVRARNRIVKLFPLENRRRALLAAVREVLAGSRDRMDGLRHEPEEPSHKSS